jgi:hypothetical protein
VRPEFEANPDKYYPTETFRKLGFSRAQCKCGHFFWRKSEEVVTCGDSKYLLNKVVAGESTLSLELGVELVLRRKSPISKLGIHLNDL